MTSPSTELATTLPRHLAAQVCRLCGRAPLAPPHPGVRTFCLLDHDCGPECPPRPYDPTEGHPRSMTETELRDHLGYPDAAETDLDRRYRARMRRRRETRDVCATIQQALITGTLPVICFLTVAILVAVLRSVW